jgi:transposase
MPQRPFSREQVFLIPPSFDDWLPSTHPARFVAAWLEGITAADWDQLGIDRTPARHGEARYAPEALLAIWVYGFMSGIRSSRGLEAACRDQIPFRWLSGNQLPDHNTLWRFYARHRAQFQTLFHRSVQTAVAAGLVDWAVQAVDGTKIAANAAGDRMLDAAQLAALQARVDVAIATLDDQGEGNDPGPPDLPDDLGDLTRLRIRIAQAEQAVAAGAKKANVTDPDAQQMKRKGVIIPAYNAQAVVAATPDGSGRVIVAAELADRPNDHGLLPDLIAAAARHTGQVAELTVADTGYHDGASLMRCAEAGYGVVVPAPRRHHRATTYGPASFVHDPDTDTLICPAGQRLVLQERRTSGERRYGARDAVCAGCPARDPCTGPAGHGRQIVRNPTFAVRETHARWMTSEDAQRVRRRRSGLIEGVFGTLTTRHRTRQWLLRGRRAVAAEWALLATAFNLCTLWQQGVRDRSRTV